MPCRGTGKLISNLGGSPSTVSCPWCAGTGTRQAGVDAQQRWRDQEAAESATEDREDPEDDAGTDAGAAADEAS
jgi:hypothetical protein